MMCMFVSTHCLVIYIHTFYTYICRQICRHIYTFAYVFTSLCMDLQHAPPGATQTFSHGDEILGSLHDGPQA